MNTTNTPEEGTLSTITLLCIVWYFFIFSLTHIKWTIGNIFTKKSDSLACLIGKTAIVTGGSSGIGHATAILLASRGCRVIIACRRDVKKQIENIKKRTGNPNITYKRLNLCSLQSVRMFADEIKEEEEKIDILINNAGAIQVSQKVSVDSLNALMQTNYFGAFLLTHLLVEPMKTSSAARVVFLSSGFAQQHRLNSEYLNIKDFDYNAFMTYTLYSNSKLCNILAAQEFARRLKAQGILVNSADPGAAKTSIVPQFRVIEGNTYWKIFLRRLTSFVAKDPMDAAQTTFHLASSEKLRNESGQNYFRCERWPKPEILNDQEFVDKIWTDTERLVKLRPEEKLPNTR